MFVYRMNHRSSSNQKMPKIEESDLESLGSPSFAYLRPLKPRRLPIKNDHQSWIFSFYFQFLSVVPYFSRRLLFNLPIM